MQRILAKIVDNEAFGGGYHRLALAAPGIADEVLPGQFLHLKIPGIAERILRRPFSIFKAGAGRLEILYKAVGAGTEVLSHTPVGTTVDIIAPLGTAYRVPDAGQTPILVAGGYGSAALYILARSSPRPGILCVGARSAADILAIDDFAALGFAVRIRTDDGSAGEAGLVTDSVEQVLDERPPDPILYACGPNPMLRRVCEIARARDIPAQVSLDHRLCCGVGACLTCVAKIRTGPDRWEYRRTCREGPVFDAADVVWDDPPADP